MANQGYALTDENNRLVGVDITNEYGEIKKSSGAATVIDSTAKWHAYVDGSAGTNSGNITAVTAVRTALTGATFATAGGGAQTQITGVAHGVSLNDYVTITGTSDAAQNAVGQVVAVGASGSIATSAATIRFGVYKNKTFLGKKDRKFSNAADRGAWPLSAPNTALVANDVIWMALYNEDNTNDVTIGDLEFHADKL